VALCLSEKRKVGDFPSTGGYGAFSFQHQLSFGEIITPEQMTEQLSIRCESADLSTVKVNDTLSTSDSKLFILGYEPKTDTYAINEFNITGNLIVVLTGSMPAIPTEPVSESEHRSLTR